MAYTTINDPSAHFHTQLYTGTGSSQSITNDANAGDFKPDWVWAKRRGSAEGHSLFDSSRGVQKRLVSNNTDAEATNSTFLTSFDTDGFTMGGSDAVNGSDNYVAWQWKANGGTTSSNTDGSITSTVQANTTAGFSIVTFSGNTTAGATVGHGLGVAPDYIQVRRYDRSGDAWRGFWAPLGDEKYLELNATDGTQDGANGAWNDTSPTSSVFSLGGAAGINGGSMIAFCFTSIQGYSKIGQYVGNGSNTNGRFVYTGFKPAFIIFKRTDSSGNWMIFDNKRSSAAGANPINQYVYPNLTNAEEAGGTRGVDFLSNGFKHRNGFSTIDDDNNTYIYMAFADRPFVTSKGAPTTAR